MSSFEERFQRGVERIRSASANSEQELRVFQKHPRFAMFGPGNRGLDRVQRVKAAFSFSSFIYGTAGPKALQYGGRGNPATAALKHWHAKTAQSVRNVRPDAAGRPRTAQRYNNLLRSLRLYDPGPRTAQYIKRGHQMMDCYFGMDNWLHFRRIPIIAEFVHYVMEFSGPFSMAVSGKEAAKATFRVKAAGEKDDDLGWKTAEIEGKYGAGMSTTKEISKIIRTAIYLWGGTIIFEGKAVYGASIFDKKARQGDTDLEAQELFKYFSPGSSHAVPFGRGRVEFQWGGVNTVPTKAHFVTNWNYMHNGLVHTDQNRPSIDKILQLFSDGHGLRPIWNNFVDFPRELGASSPQHILESIEMLSDLVTYAYGSGHTQKRWLDPWLEGRQLAQVGGAPAQPAAKL